MRAAVRPNVLLILTDQQTGSALSAAGNRWVRTPNLDRLASGGTRFVNSWCTSPVCSPARSSLVTGCLPAVTGVRFNGDRLNPRVPSVGRIFREAGYETAWVGKWHLPEGLPNLHVAGKTRGPEDDYGFRFLPCELPAANMAAFGDLSDSTVASAAAAFLRGKHEKPFLLGVSLLDPHDICLWVSNHLPENHPARKETPPPTADLPPLPANFARAADEPEFITWCRERDHYGEENTFTKSWDEAQWRRYLWTYYRMVERVDRNIGMVLKALRDAGLEDDTIVVFTADHGEGMGAHHWVVKLMLWQETLTVPLIFRWNKRVAARTDRESLISTMDFTPTVCDLAGIPAPVAMQGKSFGQLLKGHGRAARDSLFAELAPDPRNKPLQGHAVRTEQFKYVAFSSGSRPEMLFDLHADPGETRNLVSSVAAKGELDRHRTLLDQWLKSDRVTIGSGIQPASREVRRAETPV